MSKLSVAKKKLSGHIKSGIKALKPKELAILIVKELLIDGTTEVEIKKDSVVIRRRVDL